MGDLTGNGKPRLSVFKGREAKLNRAILIILAWESGLSIRQVCRKVRTLKGLEHTRYRVVNRRMKALQQECYLKLVEVKRTQQGFQANHYEPTTKAYLAIALESVDFEALIKSTKEAELGTLLATILDFMS